MWSYVCMYSCIPCYSRSKLVSSPLAEKEDPPNWSSPSLFWMGDQHKQVKLISLAQARISTPARGWNVRALLCIPCGARILYRYHPLPSISSLCPSSSSSSRPLVIIIMAIIIIVGTSLPCGALILHWAGLLAKLAGHNTPAHVHIPLWTNTWSHLPILTQAQPRPPHASFGWNSYDEFWARLDPWDVRGFSQQRHAPQTRALTPEFSQGKFFELGLHCPAWPPALCLPCILCIHLGLMMIRAKRQKSPTLSAGIFELGSGNEENAERLNWAGETFRNQEFKLFSNCY